MATEFFKKLSNDLTNLFENGEDYNVLIEVGQTPNSKIFKAHSIILSSRCSYFRNELIKLTCDNKNIKKFHKPQISAAVFDVIIKYIYGGVILFNKVDSSTIFDLLATANDFGLEELVDTAQSQLVNKHASWIRRNFEKVYRLSFEINNFKVLQKFCNDIIVKHPSILFDSEDFTNISENALVSLLKLDNLQMDEGKIWDQVIRWGIAQNAGLSPKIEKWSDVDFLSLKTTLKNCLPYVRYFQISSEDILEKVMPYQQIFDPKLWKDILTKAMTPHKLITSTILPPRVVTTTVLPPRNTSTSKISIWEYTKDKQVKNFGNTSNIKKDKPVEVSFRNKLNIKEDNQVDDLFKNSGNTSNENVKNFVNTSNEDFFKNLGNTSNKDFKNLGKTSNKDFKNLGNTSNKDFKNLGNTPNVDWSKFSMNTSNIKEVTPQLPQCFAGHDLNAKVHDFGYSWWCDICGKKNPTMRSERCEKCDFDMCMKCLNLE